MGWAVEEGFVYKAMQEKAVNPVFNLGFRLALFVINSLFHTDNIVAALRLGNSSP
jgi:hypothetical protein